MSAPTLTSGAMVPQEGMSNSILRISGLQKLQVSTNNKCYNMKTRCPNANYHDYTGSSLSGFSFLPK